jgi:hypothetical protein
MPQGDSLNEDSSDDKPHAWTRATRARGRGLAQGRVIPSARAGMGALVPSGADGLRRVALVVGGIAIFGQPAREILYHADPPISARG